MILLVDNYDSFVHNLARYLRRYRLETRVVRHDQLDLAAVGRDAPTAIVISPGPYGPSQAGQSLRVVREFTGRVPLLGVCLGHQVIVQALGGEIVPATEIVHGRASWMEHDGAGEFNGLPNPLRVGRYHSLMADPRLPAHLLCSAKAADGTVLAVRHRSQPVVGWQFHPESVLTPWGLTLIGNWLRMIGCAVSMPAAPEAILPAAREERQPTAAARPISF